MSEPTAEDLIRTISDSSRTVDERASAARSLGHARPQDEHEATAALIAIAEDHQVDPCLARAAGAGLAQLRVPKGIVDNALFRNFSEDAFWGYDEEVGKIRGTGPWHPRKELADRRDGGRA